MDNIMNKEKIKELLKGKKLKSTEDLQVFLRDLTKDVIESIYDGEITDHLGYQKNEQGKRQDENARNGSSSKKVNSYSGEIELFTPRDRNGTYDPQIVKKYQKDITGIEEKVISMYAKGMTNRDISDHIKDIYGYELSASTITNITDKVIEHAKEWQNRPLSSIYSIIFLDGIVVKQKVEGVVRNIVVYVVLGIDLEGVKECLGLYISATESAKYWLTVMNELKNRGIQDVLIFAVDNLSGISEAIYSAFPKAEIQKCIVHQIRNSLRYVSWKDLREVAKDLKPIYKAATEKESLENLNAFCEKWDKKYPYISKSWKANWAELSTFFKYTPEIRKMIYTTNPIESFNRSIRKVTKNRVIFPNEESILKLFYLSIRDIEKKWTQILREWGVIYSQLTIYFEERLKGVL